MRSHKLLNQGQQLQRESALSVAFYTSLLCTTYIVLSLEVLPNFLCASRRSLHHFLFSQDGTRRGGNKQASQSTAAPTAIGGLVGSSGLCASSSWEGDNEKVALGHLLYPLVLSLQGEPALAQKITGMLLGEPNTEIRKMIDNDQALKNGVDEAIKVSVP